MRKILFIIFPLMSIFIAFIFYRELETYRDQNKAIELQSLKIEKLNLLVGNYFVARIETLHIISSATSKAIKDEALKTRRTMLINVKNNMNDLNHIMTLDQEKILLEEMKSNLIHSNQAIIEANSVKPEVGIANMLMARVPFRNSVESLFQIIYQRKNQLIQEQSRLLNKLKSYGTLFLLLQCLSILNAVFDVRSVRR